jgi:hypothetical protein
MREDIKISTWFFSLQKYNIVPQVLTGNAFSKLSFSDDDVVSRIPNKWTRRLQDFIELAKFKV